MLKLSKYYFYFFLLCLLFTLITGVIAALVPREIAGGLTALPYLIAMISVLHLFLKQQRRAPTTQERNRFALGYVLIFWIYNAIGVTVGALIFAQNDPQIWQDFLMYLYNPQFVTMILIMILIIAIPMYLITFWFYGKQAQRMALKMFGSPPDGS